MVVEAAAPVGRVRGEGHAVEGKVAAVVDPPAVAWIQGDARRTGADSRVRLS